MNPSFVYCLVPRVVCARPRQQKVVEVAQTTPQTPSMLPRAMQTVTASLTTLEATPGRMLAFLQGVAKVPAIRAALGTMGFEHADYLLGWKLLHRAVGYHVTPEPEVNESAIEAAQELEEWVEQMLPVLDVSLKHRFPDQHAVIFAKPAPTKTDGAVVCVTRLLDRVDTLDTSDKRTNTRTQDHAALALLARRGVTAEARRSLRQQVAVAEGLADEPDEFIPADALTDEALALRYLYEARAWYEEWTTIARQVITRRDHLIRLKLAKRRASETAADDDDAGSEESDETTPTDKATEESASGATARKPEGDPNK